MDWMQMMGEDSVSGAPAQGVPYGQMMQPQIDLESAHRPVANPQEYEQRLTGWQQLAQRFMSDPNLQRAMMLTGAMMAQPLQPGQTTGGAIANAGVVGVNAYNVGQQANLAQQAALRKEARENKELGIREQESTARVAESGARVAEAQARLPGVTAEATVKAGSVDDLIASAKLQRQKLERAVSEADRDAALKELTRDNEALKAIAERGNVDRRVQQELELNDEKIASLRAGRTAQGAQARRGHAEAEQTELENEAMRSMTPQQRAAHSRAARGGASSATVQQYEMWANAYDRIKQQNPDSPEIRGRSKDEYAAWKLSSAKDADPAVVLSRLAGVLDDDDPIIQDLKAQIAGRRSGAAPAAPAPAAGPQAAPAKPKKAAPAVGTVIRGWRFKGGDPSKQENWEKIGG